MARSAVSPGRFDDLAAACTAAGLRNVRDAPVSELTTYRIGGPAAVLVRAGSPGDLTSLAAVLAQHPVDVLVVGRGSNLLVADTGFAGLVVTLDGDFEVIDLDERSVTAGGAVALPVLSRRCASAGHTGLEFYVGIPGSVGGAVAMNAGGHGAQTADVLVDADVVDLTTATESTMSAEALDFGYRRSSLTATSVVAAARFATMHDDPRRCEERIAEIVRWRREHQPGGANAGSVFTNPPDTSAGALIDAAGLKGLRVGGAVVSEKHANFFQADEGATATDVAALVGEVRRRVSLHSGVDLVPELRMIGFEP